MTTTEVYYNLLNEAAHQSRACRTRPQMTERVLRCALRAWPYDMQTQPWQVATDPQRQEALCQTVRRLYEDTYGSFWVILLWAIIKVIVAILVDYWIHSAPNTKHKILMLQEQMLHNQ